METKESSPVKQKGVTVVKGNLLEATETFICHQCNCITTYGLGLSKQIFQHFPEANTYQERSKENTKDLPGTIHVRGRIINMYAQFKPGKPSASETEAQRLTWFSECLAGISTFIKTLDIKTLDQNQVSLAFPYHIGCGLAGGKWSNYSDLLEDFATRTGVAVTLYSL